MTPMNTTSHIVSFEEKVGALNEDLGEIREQLQLFLDVSNLSLQQAMATSRTVAEFIVGQVLLSEGLKARHDLMDNIETLGGRISNAAKRRGGAEPVLPRPIYSAFHSLRIYGNEVVHPFDPKTMERRDRTVTAADLDVALAQLLRIVEWYFEDYLAPPVSPCTRIWQTSASHPSAIPLRIPRAFSGGLLSKSSLSAGSRSPPSGWSTSMHQAGRARPSWPRSSPASTPNTQERACSGLTCRGIRRSPR